MNHQSDTLDQMTAPDPLLDGPSAERVNYATGVLLSADDFRDEQDVADRPDTSVMLAAEVDETEAAGG